MILRQLGEHLIPQPVDPAVAHVADIDAVSGKIQRRHGGSHPAGHQLLRPAEYGVVQRQRQIAQIFSSGLVKQLRLPGQSLHFRGGGEGGLFSIVFAAHAVKHPEADILLQHPLHQKRVMGACVFFLEADAVEEEIIFVIAAPVADMAEARGLECKGHVIPLPSVLYNRTMAGDSFMNSPAIV